jgi:hypothetical protein
MKKLHRYEEAFEYLKPYGSNTELSKPWSFSETAIENTLKYIIDLSYNCYILIGETKELLKFEFAKTSSLLKKHLTQKNSLSASKKKTLKGKQWRIMQCVLKPFGKSEDTLFPRFIESVNVPKGLFVFSLTDSQLLRKDFQTPWFETPTHFKPPFLPMFAYSGHREFYDIPIPTRDDILFSEKPMEIKQVEWETKKPIAVFRGGITGCGGTEKTNQRIHLASLKSPLLDVGLIETSSKNLRFDKEKGLTEVKTSLQKVSKLPMFTEQILYKFIIHVDGNVLAYRLLSSFLTGSLILRVKSPYVHWLDSTFKEGKHYISIEEDLSDIHTKLDWCLKHDSKCKKIAEKGRELALKCLDKEFIRKSVSDILRL